MGAIADKYEMVVDQGSTFTKEITVKVGTTVVDVTGFEARMQVRTWFDADETILDLDTSNYITVGGVDGKIDINVPATVMAEVPYGIFVYDFEIESPEGEVLRLIMGKFIVRAEVTR